MVCLVCRKLRKVHRFSTCHIENSFRRVVTKPCLKPCFTYLIPTLSGKKERIDWNFCELRILNCTIKGFWICCFIWKRLHWNIVKSCLGLFNRINLFQWHWIVVLQLGDTIHKVWIAKIRFRELFISIVELQLTSVKQILTNGRSVKAIQQSNDSISLGSNWQLKKLTDWNAHNTIKWKYFEPAILKYSIHSDFSPSLFVSCGYWLFSLFAFPHWLRYQIKTLSN